MDEATRNSTLFRGIRLEKESITRTLPRCLGYR